ncbi:MAG: paraquat-inducible protein A [Bacteroidetes bacterium]|nr:paraquat-inducible protein A [Bacteroidota bacterium]
MIKDKPRNKFFTIVLLTPVILFSFWCGLNIYHLTQQRSEIKKDYSIVNSIKHGLLSVDVWSAHVKEMANKQIDAFDFNDLQEDTLKASLNKILNSVITKANTMVNKKQTRIDKRIKKFAIKQFVDFDKVREKVPEFSQTIINELKKPGSKERIKFIAKTKVDEFADKTRDSIHTAGEVYSLFVKYRTSNLSDFNKFSAVKVEEIQQETYHLTYLMVGCLIFCLLLWLILINQTAVHTPLFIMSVILALITLVVGLLAPMIEIDARIKEINFTLVGSPIVFSDQVIFYQSKSILDVVHILISTGKADSIFVGSLILIFSVIFPITKLLCTEIYLLGNEKTRANKFLDFFAFKSGKWSMADVMVVAIFMAYIGFKGIFESQISHLNYQSEHVATIATNETSLQPGVILFVWYVIFGLILGAILKKITFKEKIIDLNKLRFIRGRKTNITESQIKPPEKQA